MNKKGLKKWLNRRPKGWKDIVVLAVQIIIM